MSHVEVHDMYHLLQWNNGGKKVFTFNQNPRWINLILLILKSQSTILNVSMSIAHNVQIMKYTGRGDSNKHYLIQTQQKTQEPGEGNTNNGKVFVSYPKRRRPSGGGDYSDSVPVICQTLGLLLWVSSKYFYSSPLPITIRGLVSAPNVSVKMIL